LFKKEPILRKKYIKELKQQQQQQQQNKQKRTKHDQLSTLQANDNKTIYCVPLTNILVLPAGKSALF
jgi:uncharacterized protein YeaO (DUF488 family)